MVSPLTGKTLDYHESYTIRATPTATSPPDVDAMMNTLNSQFVSGNIDAQCDSILLLQGAITDEYKLRTWIAEEQPMAQGRFEISNAVIYAAVAIMAMITAIILTIAIMCYTAFMAVSDALLPGQPSYVGTDGSGNTQVFHDWAAYYSSQQTLYWYVCPYCGVGFGLKSSYPNIEDVPQAEVDAYNDHVAICEGIPKTNYDATGLLVWAIVGVGGIAFFIYGLPKIISAFKGRG